MGHVGIRALQQRTKHLACTQILGDNVYSCYYLLSAIHTDVQSGR